jgi:hypothetical protein
MGLVLVLFAVAGLVRPQLLSSALRDFDHESFSTLAIGLIAMGAGLAIVLSHNVWDGTWRVWITLFGWGALLKGFAYLIAPQSLIKVSRSLLKSAAWMQGFLVVILILGLYLAYKGFGN